MRIVTGALTPDAGSVTYDGRAIDVFSPTAARSLGIAAIHQHPTLFPDLSVAENLALGLESAGAWTRIDWRARRDRARELLARVGARIDVDREAASLSLPEQQLVEIARALGAQRPAPDPRRADGVADAPGSRSPVRARSAELRAAGTALIYISHRLEELPRLADRVTVLRDGQTVGTREMADVTEGELIRLMVGREVEAIFPKREIAIGDPLLTLEGVTSRAAGVHDVSFTVRRGEIVGLAGLVGAGRTELARVLFGLEPLDGGHDSARTASRFTRARPQDAIAHGIAYLPEDRRRHGVILDLGVDANLTLAALNAISKARLSRSRRPRRRSPAVWFRSSASRLRR